MSPTAYFETVMKTDAVILQASDTKWDYFEWRKSLSKIIQEAGLKDEHSLEARIACGKTHFLNATGSVRALILAPRPDSPPVKTRFRIKQPGLAYNPTRNWDEFEIEETTPEAIVNWIYEHMDLWRGGPMRDNYDKPARSKPAGSKSAPKKSDKNLTKRKKFGDG